MSKLTKTFLSRSKKEVLLKYALDMGLNDEIAMQMYSKPVAKLLKPDLNAYLTNISSILEEGDLTVEFNKLEITKKKPIPSSASSHTATASSHAAPSLSHAAPSLSHAASASSHAAPSLSHAAPSLSHAAPSSSDYPRLSSFTKLPEIPDFDAGDEEDFGDLILAPPDEFAIPDPVETPVAKKRVSFHENLGVVTPSQSIDPSFISPPGSFEDHIVDTSLIVASDPQASFVAPLPAAAPFPPPTQPSTRASPSFTGMPPVALNVSAPKPVERKLQTSHQMVRRVDLPKTEPSPSPVKAKTVQPTISHIIRNAQDISDILKTIKQPNHVHIASVNEVDYKLAKMFGFQY